jgi:hypothetical protein
VSPPGWATVFDWNPLDESTASLVRLVLIVSSSAALIGLWTRVAGLASCLSAVYVLGLPNFFGKIDHYHHHLIWFSALLAVSPAADVWAVDAWRARAGTRTPPAAAVRYALPIRLAWLMIGVSYFFAGISKLRIGPEWVLSDHLRNVLYLIWSEKGFLPPFRIDQYPLLCRSAALLTIVFEIGFLPSLFFPRLRPFMLAGGLVFHAMNAVFLRIVFASWSLCYVIFVDWAALGRRLRGQRAVTGPDTTPPRVADARVPRAIVVTGSVLLGLGVVFGALRIDSWPFSVYPEFAWIQRQTARTALEFVVESPDGSVRNVELPINHVALRRLLATPDPETRRIKLEALRVPALERAGGLKQGEILRLEELKRSTLPEDGGRALSERKLLAEFAPPSVD